MLTLTVACGREAVPYVRLSDTEGSPAAQAPATSRSSLHLAVSAVVSPRATFDSYDPVTAYLSAALGRPVSLVQRGTYAEINELVRTGGVDVAFVCSGAYVEGHREFGMELLAAPRVDGASVYYAYLVVPAGAEARSLADLRGRSFAFTDPLSNSGRLVVQAALHDRGTQPERFFSKTTYSGSHDNSILAVADGVVDGVSVDSLVYDRAVEQDAALGRRTRIIERYGPFGMPPVVVRPDLDVSVKDTLRRLLLDMGSSPDGMAALRALHVDAFEPVNDSAYEPIRLLAAPVRRWRDPR